MNSGREFSPVSVDRPLTQEEYELVRWILENGAAEGRNFLNQLEKARVIALCGCGCASIDFSIDGTPRPYGPLQILGEFSFGSEKDQNCSEVFVFAVDGVLAGLEVVEYHDPNLGVLPRPNELTPL